MQKVHKPNWYRSYVIKPIISSETLSFAIYEWFIIICVENGLYRILNWFGNVYVALNNKSSIDEKLW